MNSKYGKTMYIYIYTYIHTKCKHVIDIRHQKKDKVIVFKHTHMIEKQKTIYI